MNDNFTKQLKRVIREGGKVSIKNRKGLEVDITNEITALIVDYLSAKQLLYDTNYKLNKYSDELNKLKNKNMTVEKVSHIVDKMVELETKKIDQEELYRILEDEASIIKGDLATEKLRRFI